MCTYLFSADQPPVGEGVERETAMLVESSPGTLLQALPPPLDRRETVIASSLDHKAQATINCQAGKRGSPKSSDPVCHYQCALMDL